MKAVAWTGYGAAADVLKLVEVEKPVPGKNELLIRVCASAVTTGDARLRGMRVPTGFKLLTRLAFGVFAPRRSIPGMSFSGEVEAVGEQVIDFKLGDRVYGASGMHFGAHAEYLCLPDRAAIAALPDEVDHLAAVASVFGGQTAIHFLREKSGLSADHRILINGASGSVGVASVQLAKHLGADVTAVCSTANAELVTSLGADRVIDYTQERIEDAGGPFDFVMDMVGNLSLKQCDQLLTPEGRLIAVNTDLMTNVSALWNRRLICGVAAESKGYLDTITSLLRAGHMKPVIDRVYPLEQIVAAHDHVDTGHKTGNVVVQI